MSNKVDWLAGTIEEAAEGSDGKYLYSIWYNEDNVVEDEVPVRI